MLTPHTEIHETAFGCKSKVFYFYFIFLFKPAFTNFLCYLNSDSEFSTLLLYCRYKRDTRPLKILVSVCFTDAIVFYQCQHCSAEAFVKD